MANNTKSKKANKGLIYLLKPYTGLVFLLIFFALVSNGLNLWIPRLIGNAIDDFTAGELQYKSLILTFSLVVGVIFLFTYLQSILQTYASERVARDLRQQLSDRIAMQSYAYIDAITPAKLLTNLTVDVDAIKTFVSQAIVSIVSSVFIIIGASFLMLSLNWKLALVVMASIPILGLSFYSVLGKVRRLFLQSRTVIDWLNKVINESIVGAAIIRVLNAQQPSYEKFLAANEEAKFYGLAILRLFAVLIPIIIFTTNLAGLSILFLGGHFVIGGSMSLGDFAAFNSYLALLIFPILVIGFMSNVIAQATASYQRIYTILETPLVADQGTLNQEIKGDLEVSNLSIQYGQKKALKNISFSVNAGNKLAVIGPTAAGKTQLLYAISRLVTPSSGKILLDGQPITSYQAESFHKQVGLVFQDSIIFNLTIRENIAFNQNVSTEALEKAIKTAELSTFIAQLPQGLETRITERGSNLSGGQKQRIMLARALALSPKILLLDDFTARVDSNTERQIIENLNREYPGITLISVTQKIASVSHFEKIIVLMEGELVSNGTHEQLLQESPEYQQIYNSQQSTSNYEL